MDTIVLRLDAFKAVTSAEKHVTYEQQAEATGLSVGVLHRLRNGGPAAGTTIARICTTYGVAFDDLFVIGTVTPAHSRARTARHEKAVA